MAYQTAYLKTWFPVQYMAAVLTYESSARKTEDRAVSGRLPEDEVRGSHRGITKRRHRDPPSIISQCELHRRMGGGRGPNQHQWPHRFGLGAIKGVGKIAIESIIEERGKGGPFTSLHDLYARLSSRTVNRATLKPSSSPALDEPARGRATIIDARLA